MSRNDTSERVIPKCHIVEHDKRTETDFSHVTLPMREATRVHERIHPSISSFIQKKSTHSP
jgi:hypothetical protein